jgi:hypothetical protein
MQLGQHKIEGGRRGKGEDANGLKEASPDRQNRRRIGYNRREATFTKRQLQVGNSLALTRNPKRKEELQKNRRGVRKVATTLLDKK